MSRPSVCRLSVAFVLGCLAAPLAQAGSLYDAFGALPKDKRVAVQKELARADLYLADANGTWSAATERALLRSVETIALKSQDRLHPKLNSVPAVTQYLRALSDGTYSRLLYGGGLIDHVFFLNVDPVLEIEG
jgi:hypothetical protein